MARFITYFNVINLTYLFKGYFTVLFLTKL